MIKAVPRPSSLLSLLPTRALLLTRLSLLPTLWLLSVLPRVQRPVQHPPLLLRKLSPRRKCPLLSHQKIHPSPPPQQRPQSLTLLKRSLLIPQRPSPTPLLRWPLLPLLFPYLHYLPIHPLCLRLDRVTPLEFLLHPCPTTLCRSLPPWLWWTTRCLVLTCLICPLHLPPRWLLQEWLPPRWLLLAWPLLVWCLLRAWFSLQWFIPPTCTSPRTTRWCIRTCSLCPWLPFSILRSNIITLVPILQMKAILRILTITTTMSTMAVVLDFLFSRILDFYFHNMNPYFHYYPNNNPFYYYNGASNSSFSMYELGLFCWDSRNENSMNNNYMPNGMSVLSRLQWSRSFYDACESISYRCKSGRPLHANSVFWGTKDKPYSSSLFAPSWRGQYELFSWPSTT